MFVNISSYFLNYLLILLLFIASTHVVSAQIFPDTSGDKKEEVQVPGFPEDEMGRRTPRGTVAGFLTAVANENFSRAGEYLNLPENLDDEEETERLVLVLERLLDRGGNIIPYSLISNDSLGSRDDDLPANLDRIGTVSTNEETLPLYVEKTEGPEGGPIWLFSSETMQTISAITVADSLIIERILPDFLEERHWGGVPIGHWLILLIIIILAYAVAWAFIKFLSFLLRKTWSKARIEPGNGIIRALGLPFRLYLAVWLFVISTREIGVSIIVRQNLSWLPLIIGLIAFLILLWKLADFISNFSKNKMSLRGNVSGVSVILFLRRAAKVAIIIFGFIAILGVLGVNVTAGIAALGIGGIALALGAQKTVENFVGSVTLITDQPVRVGDFCKVGDTTGHVEQIGMRSTRIRTLTRTLVTIPNGQFSSEKIENYAHRDKFLFNPILEVRYETTPDQIRFLLVELRSILYSHPMVNPDPARIRFGGFGAASLIIEIFSYINAPNYEEFLEVREDILLRMMDVVASSGTDFAFPSQTLYFAKDKGVSPEKAKEAEEKVKQWKEKNELALPRFDEEKIKEIKDTIKYPPEGSVKNNKDKV